MSDEPEEAPQRRRRRIRTQRLEAFSDGVFAIAVTLLVLDLVVPPASTGDLLTAFLKQWPAYLAYLVSFSTIGALWLEHSLITEYLEQADPIFVRLNLLLLLIVSFLPFPTRLLAEFLSSEEAEKVAVTIYGLTLLAALIQLSLLWRYAVREHLVRVDVAEDELTILTRRLTPGLGGYIFLLVFGLFRPTVALIGYLAIAVFFILPLGRGRRRGAARNGRPTRS